jgi:hypothetical protein
MLQTPRRMAGPTEGSKAPSGGDTDPRDGKEKIAELKFISMCPWRYDCQL